MNDKKRKRLLYRTSPDYRAQALRRAAQYHAANSADPDYCRLVQLRKDIYRVRESYEARMRHATRLDRRLVELVTELVKVEKRWKAKRTS